MMWVARMVESFNRLFSNPMDYAGKGVDAYSQWEFDTGGQMYQNHFAQTAPLRGLRVLDIGCGAGGKSVYYATQSPGLLCALDILELNINQASDWASRHGDTVTTFIAGDATILPFADNSFDVITATDTFEHFPDPKTTLAEVARVLVPGGQLLFYFTPHRSPLGSHLYDVIHMPWCHLLVPPHALYQAVRIAYTRVAEREGCPDPDEEGIRRADDKWHYYRTGLNHMTVGRFTNLVNEIPDLSFEWLKRRPLKTSKLALLTRIPILDEWFTTLAIGVVKKRG